MGEIDWIEYDLKIEELSLEMHRLSGEYLKKHPGASRQRISDYINRKLKSKTQALVRENFKLVRLGLEEQ